MNAQGSALDHVATAVDATTIISDHGFAWFGKRPPRLPGRLLRALDPPVRKTYLTGALAEHLYSYFYVKGYAAPMHWEPADAGGRDPGLVDRLRQANTGRGSWESGWAADRASEQAGGRATGAAPELHLDRDGIRVSVRNPGLVSEETPGRFALRIPNELPSRSPGHYLALSDTPWLSGSAVVRVYWHCTPRGAVALMANLTAALNSEQVPFRLKMLDEPGAYDRCDAAVLYLAADDFETVRSHLARAQQQAVDELRAGTPVFTKRLAGGVAMAEDVDEGRSFGMHRCAALAEGLVATAGSGRTGRAARLAQVAEHLDARGVRIAAPYLRPGSADRYRELSTPSPWRPPVAAPSPLTADDALAGAVTIGEDLVRTAHWDGDRCTWLGSVVPAGDGRVLATLGSTLYDGLAGVALVLAQLHCATGEAKYADTARAALRQGLALDAGAKDRRPGLFDGTLGIALAAAHVSRLLDDAPLGKLARELAHEAIGRPGKELDLISGAAGRVLGGLELASLLGDTGLVDGAARLGDLLLGAATHAGDGLSWGTINRSREYHLTGLSHGTAGVAMSLIELFGATGEQRFRAAAERGFAYERQWFDPAEGNWPDLRETRVARNTGTGSLAYSTYWCHGAPGIAISRLRAWHLTADPMFREEAVTALATTRKFASSVPLTAGTDQSICHGQLGNAAILAYASKALGQAYPEGAATARDVAARGLRAFGAGGRWPLGTPGGSPGLMLGTAGIAHVFLWLRSSGEPLVMVPGVAPVAPPFSSSVI